LKKSLVLLFLLSFFILGCREVKTTPLYTSELPKWFFEPADVSHLGALGFSDKSFYGDDYSLFLAKCRAVYSLLNLENKNPPFFCPSQFQSLSSKSFKILKKKLENVSSQERIKFETREAKIPGYSSKIFVAYAYKEKKKDFPYFEDAKICSLELCKPKYLCNPTVEGYAGSLGVAFRAPTFKEQYSIAVKRALDLFLYSYNAKVESK
jgi:hypothetical protein